MILAVLLLINIGCSHVEFDLVAPSELATHINAKDDTTVQRDPLRYQLDAVDGRLVMRINNDTDSDIALLGAQSTLVDPQGQSHPLRPQAIAGHSFIKLILPPMRPRLQQSPSVGIGFGVIGRAGRFDRPGFIDDGFGYAEPRYFDVVDEDATYWDWDGETEIRMNLAFQQLGKMFTQSFVFRRVNV
jgi:hypothetical protein